MPANEVEICNMALDALGKPPILTMSESTEEATRCVRNYDTARLTVLSESPWTFARKRAYLALRMINPQEEVWPYVYDRPSDCVMLHAVLPASERYQRYKAFNPYELMGVDIYTDCGTAQAVYSIDHTAVDKWSMRFADAVAANLAMRLAPSLVRRDSDFRRLSEVYAAALARAIEFDAAQELVRYTGDELSYGRASSYDASTFWG